MSLWRLLLLTAFAMQLSLAPAAAGPNGASVAAGSASVSGQGSANVVVNQSSQNAIINWNTFNVGAGERTTINMPGASSTELDRVTGRQGPSQIFGSLNSNGQVFLVNPDGILFGKDAQVNTGSFLATTHDIANGDFMAGRYNFTGLGNPSASIVNQGSITAQSGGFAALVAPGVRNTGTITANLGTVALASGNAFTLDFYGDSLITLGLKNSIASRVIDVSTGQPLKSLVSNEGKLKANGGKVELTAVAARAVVNSIINNSGVIEANTVGTHNGMIVLGAATGASKPAGAPTQTVSVSGTLSAAGERKDATGGTIVVTGENVQLTGANINASGGAGGGAVMIGGDWGGGAPNKSLVSNPSAYLEPFAVATATTTSVDAGTTINASATNAGSGGKVIVWSNEATTFFGTIQARGGQSSGTGGFVETSGHQLTFDGSVNTGAPNGASGTLLLDPLNATIAAAAGSQVITVSSIETALASGDVVVTTVGTTGSQAGDITVASSLSWANASTLTLNAYRNITINDGVTIANTGAGNLVLRADATGTGIGTVNFLGSGMVDFSGSTGTVSIFYNPADNPSGSAVNSTSYTSPFDYRPYVLTNGAVTNQLTAYMLVNSVYDLQNIQNNLSGTYALGTNIDASTTASWNSGAGFAPIDPIFIAFSGVLNGNNHTINQLTINNSSNTYVGLFGHISFAGTIENVALTNVSIYGSGSSNAALAGENDGTIIGSSVTGSVSGINVVGGLVGTNTGSISNSSSLATITSNAANEVGGLVALNSGAGTITQSFATGPVSGGNATAFNGVRVGGLVGINDSNILKSYATGSVTANGLYSQGGGLVGLNSGNVTNSYAKGSVSGNVNAAGGLAGANSGTINYSYSNGLIPTGNIYYGGLVGYSFPLQGVVNYSYWDTETSNHTNSAGGAGLTTAGFQSGLPTNFDPTVWGSNASINNGYPYLLWTQSAPSPSSTTTFMPTPGSTPTPPPTPIPIPSPSTPSGTASLLNQNVNYAATFGWSLGQPNAVGLPLSTGTNGTTPMTLQPRTPLAIVLENANSEGLQYVYADPDFQNASSDVKAVVMTVVSVWSATFKTTDDVELASITAELAGGFVEIKQELSELKTAANDVMTGNPGGVANYEIDQAFQKIAETIVGGSIPPVAWNSAKSAGYFLRDYEAGFIASLIAQARYPQ